MWLRESKGDVPQWGSAWEERVALRAPLRKLVERQTGQLVSQEKY